MAIDFPESNVRSNFASADEFENVRLYLKVASEVLPPDSIVSLECLKRSSSFSSSNLQNCFTIDGAAWMLWSVKVGSCQPSRILVNNTPLVSS
jgi:hypothetical protein